MVPGGKPPIDIVYNITRGMLYILLLHTTMGKHRQVLHISVSILTSLLILPFTLLLVTFSCLIFSAVNEVNYHKKSRHSDLELDNFWVTQCG